MAKISQIVRSERKPRFRTRKYVRCRVCGRSRGFMRRFELCRVCFRELASRGMIPGVTKASW
ncbi:MAG: type Z 30S ribosomal protein S14 [Candidatus Omnitrophica bacterium]|nr:type Z 30S ribosomal protein S14 [Candidatus Omnitrophota bacterium]